MEILNINPDNGTHGDIQKSPSVNSECDILPLNKFNINGGNHTMFLNFEEIKNSFKIADIARDLLNLELHPDGINFRGLSVYKPHHNDTCTLYNVNENYFYDYKEQKSGDVIDLVAIVKFGDESRVYDAAKFLAGDKFDGAYWAKYCKLHNDFEARIKKGS